MGFVGAGGLGQRIHVAISLFHEHQLMTLIVAIYAIVTLVGSRSVPGDGRDWFRDGESLRPSGSSRPGASI
jgi:hypothetical protein